MSDATARLLWAASSPGLSLDAVTAALREGADVARASDIARSQHLAPLLRRALTAAGVEPPVALEREASRCRAQSRMVLPMIGDRLLRPLADANVGALVIKGAALAPRYPDTGLRPMDDVDLLAPAGQFDAAVGVLTAAGWRMSNQATRSRHEVALSHADLPGLAVDLHAEWSSWRRRSNRLRVADLWDARVATTLYGAPAYVLAPEEEFVMLAAHAAKPFHNFDRLIWVTDLAVVGGNAALDWDRVERFARAVRCRVAVAVGLTLAARLGLGSPAPLRTIPARRRAALAPLLDEDWPVAPREPHIRDRLRYALVDDARGSLDILAGEVFGWGVAEAPRRSVRSVRRAWQRRQAHSA